MEKPPAAPATLKDRPTLKEHALAAKSAREAREAAALRANLLRRKTQARSRGNLASDDQPPAASTEADDKG